MRRELPRLERRLTSLNGSPIKDRGRCGVASIMKPKSDEKICLFVRDEHSGHFLFNPMALQILGINPAEARQRGYPIKEQSALAEAAEDLTVV